MLINKQNDKIFHVKCEKANLLNIYVEGGLSRRNRALSLRVTFAALAHFKSQQFLQPLQPVSPPLLHFPTL